MPDSLLDKYLKKWSLQDIEKTISTHSGIVYFTKRNNTKVVLKLPKNNSDERHSSKCLLAYNSKYSVELLEYESDALLIKEILPGTTLEKTPEEDAVLIFCNLVSKLHATSFNPKDFRDISTFIGGYDRYLMSDNKAFPDSQIIEAKEIYKYLLGTQNKKVLLHGDLHHENILLDSKNGWLSIDPKGFVGEAEYEIGAFMRNPICHPIYIKHEVISKRADIISSTLKLNRQRILDWTYVQTILAIYYGVQDEEDLKNWISLANTLRKDFGCGGRI